MKKISGKTAPKMFISFGSEGTSFAVPKRMLKYLESMLSSMADGKGFRLILEDENLSTQEAADMLNVSRPHLVKLLEQGDIPFQKVGKHRRVKLTDLQEYERKLQTVRNNQLDFLARQGQDLNMGY
ncbi:MAG: helix-turn-helix domain-containing protein [Bacteroidota bacterium]